MSTFTIVLLVILAVLLVAVVVLYFVGKKAQKKQAEQQEQINAMKQTVSMLVIDKKRMKLKDAGLPQIVLEDFMLPFSRMSTRIYIFPGSGDSTSMPSGPYQ